MGHFLITGRSGSGKSTIAQELQKRGFKIFDGDKILGLARWEDIKTGAPVHVNTDGYIDYSKVAWNWDSQKLEGLLNGHNDLYLCGSASNELTFHHLFDTVFILVIDEKTHEKRIMGRKNYGNYGKHPKMLKELLKEQQDFTKEALKYGATPIDATKPLKSAVDDILRHVNHEH